MSVSLSWSWPSRPCGSGHLARRALVLLAAWVGVAVQAQTAYVSSEKDHALAVVDLKTLSVTGSIPTCKRPRHLVPVAGGRQLMVACGESGQVDVIDLATRRSVRRFPLGEGAELFDLTPDGKTLYVTNEDDAVVGVIDVATGKRRAEIAVGEEPEGVLVSRDGKTVYVTSEAASLVHVIDVATGRVVKNVKVGKRPRRFALTADGSQLWVTNELAASVTVLSTRDHSVLDTVHFEVKGARASDITPVGIVMSADGKRAFVGLGRSNHVAFVDVASRKVGPLVLAGKRAWGVALNPAQDRLLVTNAQSDDLTIIDVHAAKALKTVPVGRVPHSVVVIE